MDESTDSAGAGHYDDWFDTTGGAGLTRIRQLELSALPALDTATWQRVPDVAPLIYDALVAELASPAEGDSS